MKKRFYILITLIITLTFLVSSCGPKIVRRKRRFRDVSWARVQVAGKIRIGIREYLPPFIEYDEKGNYTGFDIELARAVAKKLNLQIDFKVVKWNEKNYDLYAKNEIDCIWSAFANSEERNTVYNFTNPYIKSTYVMTVRDNSLYKNVEELKSAPITGISGTLFYDGIKQAGKKYSDFTRIQTESDIKNVTQRLTDGTADAILYDLIVMFTQIKSGEKFRILPEPILEVEYCIAFKNGEDELKNKVEAALLELEEDGYVEYLSRKWLGANISVIGK